MASIISLPLALYLFLAGQARPRLTMYVHPVRTAVVKSGQTSGLKVLFNNRETGPNVTAAQIAIWNDGSAPIHRENILEGITLRLDPDYTILEASIRKVTRAVTGFQISPTSPDQRLLTLQWRILEAGDGAIIQIIYDGPASVGRFMLHGTIEGQGKPITIAPESNGEPEEPHPWPRPLITLVAVLFPLACIIAAIYVGRLVSSHPVRGIPGKGFALVFGGLPPGLILGVIGYLLLGALTAPYPPFGF